MSNQADVHSIEALKEFRVALAIFAEEALAALGGGRHGGPADGPVGPARPPRRTGRSRSSGGASRSPWPRPRSSAASSPRPPDYTPAMSEQKELLRKAEAGLRDAETRAGAGQEMGARACSRPSSNTTARTRRISDLAGGDVPRAIAVLDRMIDALEAYLRVAPPSGAGRPEAVGDRLDVGSIVEADPSSRGRRAPRPPDRRPRPRATRPSRSAEPDAIGSAETSPDRGEDAWPTRTSSRGRPAEARDQDAPGALAGRPRPTWNDSVRQRFEERYLAPLDPAVDAAVIGMQKLAEVLDKVRRDCSDRSETL